MSMINKHIIINKCIYYSVAFQESIRNAELDKFYLSLILFKHLQIPNQKP